MSARASAGSDPGVRALPVAMRRGEVFEPDLLELGRGVEDRAVADAGVGGYRFEDRVARLLGATVGHREDRVRPVGIRRPLIAVADAAERGHPGAELED